MNGKSLYIATTLENTHSLVKKNMLLLHDSLIPLLDSQHIERLKHVDLETHTRCIFRLKKKTWNNLNANPQENRKINCVMLTVEYHTAEKTYSTTATCHNVLLEIHN